MAVFSTRLLYLFFASAAWCQYNTKEIVLDPAKHDEQFLSFRTRPDIEAPRWVSKVYNESALAPGYWFVAPYGIVKQTTNQHEYVAPIIYDQDGGLIWNGGREVDYCNVYTLQVVNYAGEEMLSYLQPEESHGVLMNNRYVPVKHVRADDGGVDGNMHDFQIVNDATRALYMTTRHKKVSADITRAAFDHDGECHILFNGFKERDIETDEVVFSWDSEEHIALSESYSYPVPDGYPYYNIGDQCNNEFGVDYIHGNSIEKLPDGDYLMSARSMSAIYRISHVDGSIVWRLGGKKSDFTFTEGTHFSGQHDARCHFMNETHMTISIMDNAVGVYDDVAFRSNPNSRGLVMSLNLKTMVASEVARYDHPGGPGSYASERGNVQLLPNGNVFISWTDSGHHSEYTADGTLIAEAKTLTPLKSYRSYKFPWYGFSFRKPDVYSEVVSNDGDLQTVVRVSWNGDLDTTKWNIYETDVTGVSKKLLTSTDKTGFETTAIFQGYIPYIKVDATNLVGEIKNRSRSDVIRAVFVPEAEATGIVLGAAPAVTKTKTMLQAAATTVFLPATAKPTGTYAPASSGNGGWKRLGETMPSNPLIVFLQGVLFGGLLLLGIRKIRLPHALQRIRRRNCSDSKVEYDDEKGHWSDLLHQSDELMDKRSS